MSNRVSAFPRSYLELAKRAQEQYAKDALNAKSPRDREKEGSEQGYRAVTREQSSYAVDASNAETPAAPPTLAGVRSWIYPWPMTVPGLGRYRVDHFEVCSDCGCGTWSRYGPLALCFKCAKTRADSKVGSRS